MRITAVLTAGALALTAAPVHAYIPELTPRRNAEATVARVLADPSVPATTAGLAVMRGGRVIAGHNVDVALTPASLMKLATTAAGLLAFGPDHRFPTIIAGAGPSTAPDRLWLIGGGDPTLATVAYREQRFLPSPDDPIQRPAFASGSPTVEDLAARIEAAGVTSIGTLLADDSLFDARRRQPGWLDSYLEGAPDVSFLSALMVNEGRLGRDRRTLMPDPALGAVRMLRSALRSRGIAVGSVGRGIAPAAHTEVARVESPPLAEIVDFINRYSVNLPAELLVKSIGAATGEGSTAAGAAEARRLLAAERIPLDGFVMADGSGLSVLDRMTPRTVATILERIQSGRSAVWRTLALTIPVAGGPGTLLTRLTGPPTIGNLRGKTGLITGVRGLAGWVRAADGQPIVYAGMLNRTAISASFAALELFGLLVARFPSA